MSQVTPPQVSAIQPGHAAAYIGLPHLSACEGGIGTAGE